ncbi:MAG: hypothetical protein HZT40_08960 [Candidatus Thiothrix singaporensis]|uniref:Uncharacterized protein n=1 Tax=Candidatus Thiothrix singaporensis TaxID=2799669 RepID=A0A7L6ARF7_9GAMM|nr:MAG: hypothetical protein HZT40_08960 [Candidatus Thiothrix singaporensis]
MQLLHEHYPEGVTKASIEAISYTGLQLGFPAPAWGGKLTIGSWSLDQEPVFNELLRVNHDGNVGIGTDKPLAKLHVNGGVQVEESAHIKGSVYINDWHIYEQDGELRFSKNGTYWFAIQASGQPNTQARFQTNGALQWEGVKHGLFNRFYGLTEQ